MDTAPIIEKWYQKLGFDPRYDKEFYSALAAIQIDPAATVEMYNMNEQDEKRISSAACISVKRWL